MREASLTKMDYLLPCSEPVGGESQRNLKKKKKSHCHFLWFFNQLMEQWKYCLESPVIVPELINIISSAINYFPHQQTLCKK